MELIELENNIQIAHNNGNIVDIKEIPITHEFADSVSITVIGFSYAPIFIIYYSSD